MMNNNDVYAVCMCKNKARFVVKLYVVVDRAEVGGYHNYIKIIPFHTGKSETVRRT